ncbi:hypothetical protein R1sor_026243 [Riccia sorocarpa]|uniref:Uncharacterized protein n=1 Tax=Riccia sorocarpa TaxID=122646 RepID=A0ABD3GDX0_9MARC
MKASESPTHRRRSYFKMNFKMLEMPKVLASAMNIWQEHPSWAKDERKRWALAQGRIKKLLMEFREVDKRRMTLLKSKHAHKAMSVLESESGGIIEEQEDILQEVQRYYQNLYKTEEETTEMVAKQEVVVSRIDRQMNEEDNKKLEEAPSRELITRIAMEMPKEKSPGITESSSLNSNLSFRSSRLE